MGYSYTHHYPHTTFVTVAHTELWIFALLLLANQNRYANDILTLKEPGFLDPSHSRGGGADSAPLRSRKPIDEISSVWN